MLGSFSVHSSKVRSVNFHNLRNKKSRWFQKYELNDDFIKHLKKKSSWEKKIILSCIFVFTELMYSHRNITSKERVKNTFGLVLVFQNLEMLCGFSFFLAFTWFDSPLSLFKPLKQPDKVTRYSVKISCWPWN